MDRVLVVEDDAFVRSVLEEALRFEGLDVLACGHAMPALQALQASKPQLALVDLALPRISGVELIRRIRELPEGHRLPIVLMTAHAADGDLREASLGRLDVAEVITKPFSIFHVVERVRDLLERSKAPPEPVNDEPTAPSVREPHKPTLAALARTWARRETGRLSGPAGAASIVRGEPCTHDDLTALNALLYGPAGATFTPGEAADADPDGSRMGPELLSAALAITSPEPVVADLDRLLVDRPGAHRVAQLPLRESTLRLVSAKRDHTTTLRHLLEDLGLQSESVGHEVAALIVLGLYRLRPSRHAERKPPPEPITKPVPPPPSPSSTQDPDRIEDILLVRRLTREAELMRTADDYTVLGVPHDADEEMVRRAYARQRTRYRKLENDPELDPEVKKLVTEIARRLKKAGRRLLREAQQPATPTATPARGYNPAEEAFEAGRAAADAGRWEEACVLFGKARTADSGSPRNMAWLGWATLHDPRKPTEKRRQDALELLQLADSFDPSDPDGQFFLAAAEAEDGQARRALARVTRMLRTHSDHKGARDLMMRLRRRASAQK